MRKEIKIGSKRENAKELELNITPLKAIVFLLLLAGAIYLMLNALEGDIKNVYDYDMRFECHNGTIEEVKFNKTFYCGEHYTKLKGYGSYPDIFKKVNGFEYLEQEEIINLYEK